MKATLATVVVIIALGTGRAAANDAATQTLFKAKCASCHAADGSGNTPAGKKVEARDLRSAEVQKQTDAQLLEVVEKGKKKMPAYEKKLTEQQMKDLIAYVRELAKKK